MKRWSIEDPTGEIEGFVQHRKRCTGRVGIKSVVGEKSRVKDDEDIQRVNTGDDEEPEEIVIEEDPKVEMQFLLDAVTEVYAPKQ